MVFFVDVHNRAQFTAQLEQMFWQRKHIFIDQLGWPLPARNGLEIDAYDGSDTRYLLALNDSGTNVLASARLLPTARPHLMSDLFAHLCVAPCPTGARVWEASRFCPSPTLTGRTRLNCLWQILCAITETCLLHGIEQIIFTANSGLLPLAMQCGWRARALGSTVCDGDDSITPVAAWMDEAGLESIRRRFGIPAPITRFETDASCIAA